MIEAQNYAFVQAAEIGREQELGRVRPTLVRNSRVLIGLTFLGSAAAFVISLCMAGTRTFFHLPAALDQLRQGRRCIFVGGGRLDRGGGECLFVEAGTLDGPLLSAARQPWSPLQAGRHE